MVLDVTLWPPWMPNYKSTPLFFWLNDNFVLLWCINRWRNLATETPTVHGIFERNFRIVCIKTIKSLHHQVSFFFFVLINWRILTKLTVILMLFLLVSFHCILIGFSWCTTSIRGDAIYGILPFVGWYLFVLVMEKRANDDDGACNKWLQ